MVETSEIPLSSFQLFDLDSDITDALIECAKNDSVLPLLKQELRCKIQYRRLSQGQEELDINESEPHSYKLTEKELLKRAKRREQNRNSAYKCRLKDKDKEEFLRKKIDKLSSDNQMLVKEKNKLTEERNVLLKTMNIHRHCLQTESPLDCDGKG